eukprot:199026-Pleurochrysis_carterae.AAC.2
MAVDALSAALFAVARRQQPDSRIAAGKSCQSTSRLATRVTARECAVRSVPRHVTSISTKWGAAAQTPRLVSRSRSRPWAKSTPITLTRSAPSCNTAVAPFSRSSCGSVATAGMGGGTETCNGDVWSEAGPEGGRGGG